MPERKSEAAWIESRSRWQINVQDNGVRKTFTSSLAGRRGKAEAERKAERWLEDHTTAEKTRADVYLTQYIEHLKATKSTGHASQYDGFVRLYIRPIIGSIRMNKLTEGDLQDVIDLAYARKHLADKTLRDVRGCIMNWLKWCRQRGKTSLYPEDLLIPAGAKKPKKKIVQPGGLKTLFSCSTTLWRGKPAEDFYIHAYRFAVLTGLRPGELRALEDKNDIQGRKVTIRGAINVRDEVTQGKNENAQRTFQMSALAEAEANAQRAMLRRYGIVSPYLFPAPDGGHLVHKNFYRAWGRYCEANQIPRTSLYELRQTYVSVNKEMPEGLKKMIVGHSRDMDTEGTYGHQMDGDLAKAAAYTDQAFDDIIYAK